MRKLVIIFAALLLSAQTAFAQVMVPEWTWDDLVPADYVFPNPLDKLTDEEYDALLDDSAEAQALMQEIRELQDNAPVVEDLNGIKGSISGYALPLDFEATEVTEFLLVPYFGACIHVPPPPGNQTVYVKLDEPKTIESLWDPVTVTGRMETVKIATELASAGYQMQASAVEPYLF